MEVVDVWWMQHTLPFSPTALPDLLPSLVYASVLGLSPSLRC